MAKEKAKKNKRMIRVIKPDHTGHFQGEMELEELKSYPWKEKKEAVFADGEQITSYEELERMWNLKPRTPGEEKPVEVLFVPPLAGGKI